jgi:uncharacterized HAD superfamily protein
MTISDQANTPEPTHPIGQLTTRELSDYRRQLERALGDRAVGQAPIAADLREKLSEVVSEEADRERHRQRGQRWPLNN